MLEVGWRMCDRVLADALLIVRSAAGVARKDMLFDICMKTQFVTREAGSYLILNFQFLCRGV